VTAISPTFKVLGDPVRPWLMSMIASTGEACLCHLTEAFDVSAPTMSHHLHPSRPLTSLPRTWSKIRSVRRCPLVVA
jgi:DNA-binding transcriptional ArsR family regulator